jgi:hypothetical protein
MFEQINHDRRRLLGTAVISAAAAEFGMAGSAQAQASKSNAGTPTATSFGSLKEIEAGVLNVAYVEMGPPAGRAVILLHGWPYDVYSFAEVAPVLATEGYRVLVPYLRGFGPTRFLSSTTFRNAQPSALAVDVIEFMNALKIERAILAGFDWSAVRQHRRSVVAGTLQGHGVCERLSDQQPGSRQALPASEERARMVVHVLLCHRTRACRLRQIPARFCKAYLANSFAKMAI